MANLKRKTIKSESLVEGCQASFEYEWTKVI